MINEQWKSIQGYEGLYEISSFGRIKSLPKNGSKKEMFLKLDGGQYPHINLNKNNKHRRVKLHRLLAIHFIPNPNNHPIVNHKNGKKSDYRLDNLEWCTDRQNRLHAYATGLMSKSGEKNGNAKLTQREAEFIRFIKGLHPEVEAKEIAKFYRVAPNTIQEIWRFKKWK